MRIRSLNSKCLSTLKLGADNNFILGRHDRRQMPVGQGGFHIGGLTSGEISQIRTHNNKGIARFKESDLIYVYDCGSVPKESVMREISSLLRQIGRRKLDLLFLSHFDCDHMCGIPHLLSKKNGLQVDTIILPYIDDAERVMAFARAVSANDDGVGTISRFFEQMVIDPIRSLGLLGARQIIQIISGDGDIRIGEETTNPPSHDDPDTRVVWEIDGEKVDGDEPDFRKLTYVLKRRGSKDKKEIQVFFAKKLDLIASGKSSDFKWLLKPWVRPADPHVLQRFYEEAEKELGWPAGTFTTKMRNINCRRYVVTEGRAKVARAYLAAFSTQRGIPKHEAKNGTSMSLYSGPLASTNLDAISLYPFQAEHCLTKVGWMGTGDMLLKNEKDIGEFKNSYKHELEYITNFMLPHHGSINNSDPEHLISDAEYWTVSADPPKRWMHPHPDVQRAALKKGDFCHVRASDWSAFDESILFFFIKNIYFS
ncbi:hypothetical protein P7L75_05265 (plasmid) [Tistrella mobilis]|uniref:hypothetical protein n=1 Tax=Tistrella mobilis TaxID=171437 RepID=UPI003558AAC7